MLKGKKGLYILLPVVALIWGAIIFQVVGAFSDEDQVVAETSEVSLAPIEGNEREKFELSTVLRDPFLGTIYKPKKEVTKPKATTLKVKKPALVWPSITYKGVVSGQNASNAIYLIEINGSDQLLQLKQTFEEVTLIKARTSSVKLRYKGKIKEFKIAN